jgi:hypothetical protein
MEGTNNPYPFLHPMEDKGFKKEEYFPQEQPIPKPEPHCPKRLEAKKTYTI